MKRLSLVLGIIAMFAGVAAAEDLKVSFATYRAGHYVPPIKNEIVVAARPFPFYVVVKNTGERAAEIFEKKGALDVKHLEFEFTNSKGKKTVVSHKEAPTSRERGGYRMMQPGEFQIASVLLNAEDWKMSVQIPTDKETTWGLRVIYVNGDKRVYSASYKIIVKTAN